MRTGGARQTVQGPPVRKPIRWSSEDRLRVGVVWVDLDALCAQRFGECHGLSRVRGTYITLHARTCQPADAYGRGKRRIDFDGTLEKLSCSSMSVALGSPQVPETTLICFPGAKTFLAACAVRAAAPRQRRLADRLGHRCGNLILDSKDVRKFAIVPLSPDVAGGLGVD